MFEIEFTPVILILLSAIIVASLYLIFGFRHYVASVGKRIVKDDAAPFPTDPSAYPSVSVIVYSEDDAENLEILLPRFSNRTTRASLR